eukprot:TRINITY_DN6029_c0_g1_i2.p1 TRINITY_DN6029_c0_g1~~TRINITY_DN6029_c0_g1_i2.p1  ORF type:complete len:222 (+),score=33.40 TRINITY_DN6029_c0_g1_i2:641-1306(+)
MICTASLTTPVALSHSLLNPSMDGGALMPHLLQRESFTELEARDIIRQVLSGVAYMHSHSVAHRDLKPENLLVELSTGRVVISDFGLSKSYHSDLLSTACGTHGYVAPEIVEGNVVYTNRVDIWAVGVITFLLVYGRPPFTGTEEQMCINIVRGNFSFPENRALSPLVKDFITRLLMVDPDMRPSAQEALAHEWLNCPEAMLAGNNDLSISSELYAAAYPI